MSRRTVSAFLVIFLASACAGQPGAGSGDAPPVANLSATLEDGIKAIETGEALLTRGEKRLQLGRQQVRDGETRIQEASERAEKARLEYEQVANGESNTADTGALVKALRAVGSRWEQAILDIEAGNKLVARGKANIDRGESEIREGRLLMQSGSVLMRNAHRSRLGLSLLPMPTS